MKFLMGEDPFNNDDLLLELTLEEEYEDLSKQRYEQRSNRYRSGDAWVFFQEDLSSFTEDDGLQPWVNESESRKSMD